MNQYIGCQIVGEDSLTYESAPVDNNEDTDSGTNRSLSLVALFHASSCEARYTEYFTFFTCIVSNAVSVGCCSHITNVGSSIECRREVRLVWGQHWTSMQALVTINYYGVHGAMIYFAYVMSGFGPDLSHPMCEGFVIFGGAYVMISIGLSQTAVILLLRVMKVWDDRQFIKVALILGFGICYGMSVAFNTLMMRQPAMKILYSDKPRTCYIQDKDVYIAGTWGAMICIVMVLSYSLYYLHYRRCSGNLHNNTEIELATM
ncbi:uncharacterized protein LAESUDRAFT_779745 [Laetiporus sulphureus 93-53]|uniref:Uncharacterized protein n=1 Tax=Laetiporus sulphureus 93-53 TaxID=1314785 RepID=A0A165DWJ2_9APHY|nr:uncharacterized protein LAESUDRAFT_779745 [Laetiporus sulphureus 93-53]KZT05777.1 hypothetical protein LAESUDRAFT_779745 [Laetiporus sulphureus 93-53]